MVTYLYICAKKEVRANQTKKNERSSLTISIEYRHFRYNLFQKAIAVLT